MNMLSIGFPQKLNYNINTLYSGTALLKYSDITQDNQVYLEVMYFNTELSIGVLINSDGTLNTFTPNKTCNGSYSIVRETLGADGGIEYVDELTEWQTKEKCIEHLKDISIRHQELVRLMKQGGGKCGTQWETPSNETIQHDNITSFSMGPTTHVPCSYTAILGTSEDTKRTYTEEQINNGQAYYTYSDNDNHTIRVSNTISSLNIHGTVHTNEFQIVSFQNGSNINTLAPSCFINCKSLKTVVIQNQIYYIGDDCFRNCSKLSSVTINSVNGIGENAFRNSGVIQLDLDIRHNQLSDGEYNYEGCHTNSISSGPFVGQYAFANCTNLERVNLKTSTMLASHMFDGCTKLSTVIFANHGQEVGEYTFSNCQNLKSITLPTNFEMISKYMFNNCSKLTSVNIPNEAQKFNIISERCFNGCSNLTSFTIPSSIVSFDCIQENAFAGSSIKFIKFCGIGHDTIKNYIKQKNFIPSAKFIESTSNFKYGQWYGESIETFQAAMEFAMANGIPIFGVYCHEKCGLCQLLHNTVMGSQFLNWMGSKPYIFVYYNDKTEDNKTPEYMKNILKQCFPGYDRIGQYTLPTFIKIWNNTTTGDSKKFTTIGHMTDITKQLVSMSAPYLEEFIECESTQAGTSQHFGNWAKIKNMPKFTEYVGSDEFRVVPKIDTKTFNFWGIQDGCILESVDGIRYKYVAANQWLEYV